MDNPEEASDGAATAAPSTLFALLDEPAAERDRDGVCPASSLQLGQQVAHVGLHRLLREVKLDADLSIHEAVRDQLKDLAFSWGRLLLDPARRRLERNDLAGHGTVAPVPAGGYLVEPADVVEIAGENLPSLSSVHT